MGAIKRHEILFFKYYIDKAVANKAVERYATTNDFPLYLILVGEYNKYLRFGRLTKWGRYKNQLKGARIYPPNGAEEVSTDVSITVIFNEPVSKYTLILKDNNDKDVGGKTSMREDDKALEFKPSRLASFTTYTATIAGVKNKKNKTISKRKTWSFTTAKQSGLSRNSFSASPINIPH